MGCRPPMWNRHPQNKLSLQNETAPVLIHRGRFLCAVENVPKLGWVFVIFAMKAYSQ